MEWTRDDPTAEDRRRGVGFTAVARAPDGAGLRVTLFGERPRLSGLVLVTDHAQPGRAIPWLLSCGGRGPSSAEVMDAMRELAHGSPEWWGVLWPWRADQPVTQDAETDTFHVQGLLCGPVPEGQPFPLTLQTPAPERVHATHGGHHA